MKKTVISMLIAVSFILGGCQEKRAQNNSIYVFSQAGCGHCEHARSYMQRYYSNYDIKELNIHKGGNMNYLLKFAHKYKIPEQSLGTPLIAMGNNYVMGWGNEQMKQFNRYIKNFKPKTPARQKRS